MSSETKKKTTTTACTLNLVHWGIFLETKYMCIIKYNRVSRQSKQILDKGTVLSHSTFKMNPIKNPYMLDLSIQNLIEK